MYHQIDPRFALFVDDDATAPGAWLLDGFIRSIRGSPPHQPTAPPHMARRAPSKWVVALPDWPDNPSGVAAIVGARRPGVQRAQWGTA
jgi:hypothetical protein